MHRSLGVIYKTSPDNFLAVLHVCACFYSIFSYLPDHRIVLHDLHLIHTDLKPENILLVINDHRTVQIPVPGKVRISKPDVTLVSDLPL